MTAALTAPVAASPASELARERSLRLAAEDNARQLLSAMRALNDAQEADVAGRWRNASPSCGRSYATKYATGCVRSSHVRQHR